MAYEKWDTAAHTLHLRPPCEVVDIREGCSFVLLATARANDTRGRRRYERNRRGRWPVSNTFINRNKFRHIQCHLIKSGIWIKFWILKHYLPCKGVLYVIPLKNWYICVLSFLQTKQEHDCCCDFRAEITRPKHRKFVLAQPTCSHLACT